MERHTAGSKAGAQGKEQPILSEAITLAKELGATTEDEKLIAKLWHAYCKKKKGILSSSTEAYAAGLLWQYARLNFLWEENRGWSQKRLAQHFGIGTTTIGTRAAEMENLLKIRLFDQRFMQKTLAEKSPFASMAMTPQGFILSREMAMERNIPFMPLQKTARDHYVDGDYHLERGMREKAMQCYRKALEIDDEHVGANVGMGVALAETVPARARSHFETAFRLTKERLGNRQQALTQESPNDEYLNAIYNYAIALWKEGNTSEAAKLFAWHLQLEPEDNECIRYLAAACHEGLSVRAFEEYTPEQREALLERQNAVHGF